MPGAPDGNWGWVIVTGIVISNLSLLPIQQCFGLIFEQKFARLGIDATQTSFILHLNATIMCSLGLINGPLLKKFSYRIVACMGTTFIFFGICLSAFATSLQAILVAYCVFVAIGQGMMYPATGLALNTYFRKKRGIAMGLTITLTGLGPIGMPQLIARLLEHYGTRGTLLILAAIALHSFVGASLLWPFVGRETSDVKQTHVPGESGHVRENGVSDKIPADPPEEMKLLKPEMEKPENEISSDKTSENQKPHEHVILAESLLTIPTAALEPDKKSSHVFSKIAASLDLDLLRDNRFLIIILGMGLSLVSELNFSSMTPFVLAELAALAPKEVAMVMSVQASADIAGRLCVPLMAQKFNWSSKNLYASSLVGSIIGRSILATWSSSYTIIIAVSLLLGIAKGSKAVFQALVVPDNVPLKKLPAASGLLMVSNGLLSIAVGPLIGLVHDKAHSYVAALHFTSALSLFCVLLWVGEYFCTSRRKVVEEEK